MPELIYPSLSPTDVITVGNPPHGTLLAFRYSPAVIFNDPVEMGFAIENTGDFASEFTIDVWDTVLGTRVWQSTRFNLNPGEMKWIWSYDEPAEEPRMPNHPWTLTVQAHHDGPIDHPMITETIPLLIEIYTSLSLDISPPNIPRGEEYLYSGKLTNIDTGAGVPDQEIILYRNTSEVGRVTTNGNGDYSKSVVAPTEVGTYSCYSEYKGYEYIFGSISARRGLAVGIPPFPELAWWQWGLIVGWGILGGVGFALGRKRK